MRSEPFACGVRRRVRSEPPRRTDLHTGKSPDIRGDINPVYANAPPAVGTDAKQHSYINPDSRRRRCSLQFRTPPRCSGKIDAGEDQTTGFSVFTAGEKLEPPFEVKTQRLVLVFSNRNSKTSQNVRFCLIIGVKGHIGVITETWRWFHGAGGADGRSIACGFNTFIK